MSVDANLARAIAALWVVADEPVGVVSRYVLPDLAFQLRDDGYRGKETLASSVGALKTVVCDDGFLPFIFCSSGGWDETTEVERGFTRQTPQLKWQCVFKADRIRDLAFEGLQIICPAGGCLRDGADAVFTRVQSQTISKLCNIRATDGSAETFDWWKDLLVKVVINIRFQPRIGFEDIFKWVCVLRCRLC